MELNRRNFVRASSLTALAAAIRTEGLAAAVPQPAAPPAPAVFTPLRRNVGIFHQRGGTIGWLVSPDGLLVVDSQFADTARYLKAQDEFIAQLERRRDVVREEATAQRAALLIRLGRHDAETAEFAGDVELYARADGAVSEALALEPGSVEARTVLGLIHLERGEN